MVSDHHHTLYKGEFKSTAGGHFSQARAGHSSLAPKSSGLIPARLRYPRRLFAENAEGFTFWHFDVSKNPGVSFGEQSVLRGHLHPNVVTQIQFALKVIR